MSKFKQLLGAGLDAHLAVGARAGQAWFSLRLGLGRQPARSDRRNKSNGGPFSNRRRAARREAARQAVGNIGCVNGQHSADNPTAEEATKIEVVKPIDQIEEVDVEELTDEIETALVHAELAKVDENPIVSSVANTKAVKLVVVNEVIDKIEHVGMETTEEELVMIFFDHEYYFGAIKKTLENSISYFR